AGVERAAVPKEHKQVNQMTTPDHSDWELINAYADGELRAEDRASFEHRLATDTTLAAGLEEVHALKAKLALIMPATAGRTSQPMHAPRRLFRAVRAPAAAAAAAALLTLGVMQLLQHSSAGDWRDFSARLH